MSVVVLISSFIIFISDKLTIFSWWFSDVDSTQFILITIQFHIYAKHVYIYIYIYIYSICISSHTRFDRDTNSATRQHSIAVLRLSNWDYTHREEDRQTTITLKQICKHDNSFKYTDTHWRNFANNIGKGSRGAKSTMCVRKLTCLYSASHTMQGFLFFLSLHHTIKSFNNFSISCFSPLQLSTRIKLFLGAKNIGGAFASLAPPPHQVRLMSLRIEKIIKQYLGL